MGIQHGASHHRKVPLDLSGGELCRDAVVQPASVDPVPNEVLVLDHVGAVVNDGMDLASHAEIFERHHHGADGGGAGVSLGKDVPKLGVAELVDAAAGLDAEVAPHVGRRAEGDLLNLAGGGLEAVVGVLARDTHCHNMAVRGHLLVRLKVDVVRAVRWAAKEAADIRDAREGHAHPNEELSGRQVHPRDPLGDRVLHLQARVELQEVVAAVLQTVKVLNGRSAHIAHSPGQGACAALHVRHHLGRCGGDGPFLHNLLVAALH
mmetsp:Transcript_7503/g.21228  ORF Transcript_7503/g.21228 Transcript_7503/m.21228 type:complete len:263 (-) Transcript_7503:893-1681(-)